MRFFCWMHWHSYGYENYEYHCDDPNHIIIYAKCRWCGFEGQVDSQGNLF